MEQLSPLRTRRKNHLIETAEDYFIEYGLHSSTMEDIATASGISRQTVYRYYASKEDLAFAVEVRVLERIFTRMEELFSAAAGITIEQLYDMADELMPRFIEEYERELKFTGVFDAYFQHYPDSHYYQEMKEVLSRFENPFVTLLELEQKRGNFHLDIPIPFIGETISNSLLALCQRVLLRREPLQEEYGTDPVLLVPIQLKLFLKSFIHHS